MINKEIEKEILLFLLDKLFVIEKKEV